jgi:hypothetical protein
MRPTSGVAHQFRTATTTMKDDSDAKQNKPNKNLLVIQTANSFKPVPGSFS